MPAPEIARAFSRRLRAWFRRRGRDLPWRRTRDPYQVLVSELSFALDVSEDDALAKLATALT